jgi:hypothetical protein
MFYAMLFILPGFHSCKQSAKEKTQAAGIVIKVSADSTGIELHHIPSFITDNFAADTLAQLHWKNFLAVYEEPNDPELRDIQPPLKGAYSVENGLIKFKPDAGFIKGHVYFAQCYAKKMLLEPQNLIINNNKLLSAGGFIEYKFRF